MAASADVIDADEDAYTVEYLQRLRAKHEERAAVISNEDAEHGARQLFINQQVLSTNQVGGITAHIVHVHNYSASEPKTEVPTAHHFVLAKDGAARFRAPGEPLGSHWDIAPFGGGSGHDIFLAKGPAIWLRVMASEAPPREWVHEDLFRCARSPNVPLQPLLWSSLHYLRAEDGIGAYATSDPLARESETESVAFAFTTGELWSIDTSILKISRGENLFVLDIARTLLARFRRLGEFLECLGMHPLFRWIAGIEGVKGWTLKTPPIGDSISFSTETCLSDVVSAEGTFDPKQPPAITLLPFFRQLYRKCGMKIPEPFEELLQNNRNF